MRIKKYESKTLIYTVTFIILLVIIGLLVISSKKLVLTYKIINASVIKDDLVETLVTDTELKTIYNNKYMYLNSNKVKIKIEEINKKVLKRKNEIYHSVILKVNLNKDVKTNDIETLVLFDKKINVLEMIQNTWKGV